MPLIDVNGWTCHYRFEGEDKGPVLVLAHALGLDLGQWDAQVRDFAPHFRIVRYDIRGHGVSGSPADAYTIDELARDALALLDALGIERFAFCGVSLGGMIGLWLAAHAGDRLTAAVLANTSPRLTDRSVMETRRQLVLDKGMSAVADTVLGRFFSPQRLTDNPSSVATARRTLAATNPVGYAGACAAIRDMDQSGSLARVSVPVLVIQSEDDVVFGWEDHGRVLAEAIAGAEVARIPGGHLGNVEAPRAFSAAVLDFLVPPPLDRWSSGLEVRRAILGHAHVDRAMASTTDFTREFQELITTYAWGTIWTRPGLDPRTRRLLVLAMMVVLGRWEEFRMHLRAGLEHDLEWPDVNEVLLQAAIYGGVPVANTAFHIAAEERSRHETSR
jgi:3-oxoadipate enol-lactonase/4-carboxymuconolactone decarboxylase